MDKKKDKLTYREGVMLGLMDKHVKTATDTFLKKVYVKLRAELKIRGIIKRKKP